MATPRVHKFRLLLVVTLLLALAGAGGGALYWHARKSRKVDALAASAQRYHDAGQLDKAAIEIDKWLRLRPNDAQAHYLRAQCLLRDIDPATVRAGDDDGIAGVRALIQTVRHRPNHLAARRLLLAYFLGSGDVVEAAKHGAEILQQDAGDPDARYALAAAAQRRGEPLEAKGEILALAEIETPLRPRSAAVAAQLADKLAGDDDFAAKAAALIAASLAGDWSEPADRIALADLHSWQAARTEDPAEYRAALTAAVDALDPFTREPVATVPPRTIVRAAGRLLGPTRTEPALAAVQDELRPRVETLIDQAFASAIAAEVLDPMVYVEAARRVHEAGDAAQAVAIVNKGLELAEAGGPDIRARFAVGDLWLAEHYLIGGQPLAAQPHLDLLLASPSYARWGHLLSGFADLQAEELADAGKHLGQAIEAMPDHGVANTLYGLCQLRRGFVRQGRRYIERGVRLGADQPRYQSWLAVALAEAGYNDEALALAKRLAGAPETAAVGRGLLGQLMLRTGQVAPGDPAFAKAVDASSGPAKSALQLVQLRASLKAGDGAKAKELYKALQGTPQADAGVVVWARYLDGAGKSESADKLLARRLEEAPRSAPLLAESVRRMIDAGRTAEAVADLQRRIADMPDFQPAQVLLAEVHQRAGAVEASLAVLREAATNFPDEPAVGLRLAERLLNAGQFEEATRVIADLKDGAGLPPGTLDYLLARSAMLQGNAAQAARIVREGLDRDAEDPELLFLKGQLAARVGDFGEASRRFEESLESGAFEGSVVTALFESLLRSGDTDKATTLLRQAEDQGAGPANGRRRLVRLLAQQRDWPRLQVELERILADGPSQDDVSLVVAMLRVMGKPADARKVLDRYLAEYPAAVGLLQHRLALLIENGDFPAADAEAQRLTRQFPKETSLWTLAAVSRFKQDQPAAAAKVADAGLTHLPGDPALVALKVQALVKQDDAAGALAFAEETTARHKDLPAAAYIVGRMQEAVGNDAAALALYEQAVAAEPHDADLAQHFLRLRIARGGSDLPTTVAAYRDRFGDSPAILGLVAEYLINAGKLATAREVLGQLQAVAPNQAATTYTAALIAFATSDYDTAEKQLTATANDPRGHVPSMVLQARLAAAQGHAEQALETIEHVLQQRPRLASARSLRLAYLNQAGRTEDAVRASREYLKDDPGSPALRHQLAQSLSLLRTDAATAEARRIALELVDGPLTGVRDFESCIAILLRTGATAEVDRIVSAKAKAGDLPLTLAGVRACLQGGHTGSLLEWLQPLRAAKGDDPGVRLLYADALTADARRRDDPAAFERAADEYRKVLADRPDNFVAANNLAWILGEHLGKPHRALEELTRLVPQARAVHPSLPATLLDTVGTLQLRIGRLDAAERFLQAAIDKSPRGMAARFHLGQVYQQQGRDGLARRQFARISEDAPGSEWAGKIDQTMLAQ